MLIYSMSYNKLKNIWLSTDTAIPGGCSMRNEGTSIFSGLVDISGQVIYEPTSNIVNKNYQYISLATDDYQMSVFNNGAMYLITTSSVAQAKVVILPASIPVGGSFRCTMINATGTAVKIICYPGSSTHQIQPSFISTIGIPVSDNRTFILYPGLSCEIQTDNARRWCFRDGPRNNLDNVWNKKNRFDDFVGFGGQTPTYTVDVSGDINFTGNLLLNGSTYVPGGNLLPLTNTWTAGNTFENYLLIDGTTNAVFENTGTTYASSYATLTSSGYMYANQVSGRMVNLSSSGGSMTMTLPNLSGTPHGIWFYLTGDPNVVCTVNCYGSQTITTYETQISSIQLGKNETVYFQAQVSSGSPYWIMFRLSSTNLDQVLKYGTTWAGDNTFTGYTYFDTHLPRSGLTPNIATHLTPKSYVDGLVSGIYTSPNTWSGTQTIVGQDGYSKNLNNIVNGLDYDVPSRALILGGNQSIVNYDLGGGAWETDINSAAIAIGTGTSQVFLPGALYAFQNAIPVYDGTNSFTLAKQFITRGYADTRYVQSSALPALLNQSNTFTSTNQYNVHPQYSGSIQPLNANEYTPKSYVDTAASGASTALLSSANTWGNTNNFGTASFSLIPTYTGGASMTTANQLTTKGFTDSTYAAISNTPTLTGTNTFTNTQTFNGNVAFNAYPTYTGVAVVSSGNQFTTKSYVDNAIATGGGTVLLASNNTWTGQNSYNTYLPTSSLTPTASNQLITKAYADGTFLTSASGINASNITSGTLADARLSANVLLSSSSLNASNLTSGTLPDARLSANVLLSSSSLNASNLTSGTLPDARLSSSVVLTSGAQTINGAKIFGDNAVFQSNLQLDGNMTLGSGASSTCDNQGIFTNSYQYKNAASQWNTAYITYITNTTLPTTVSGRTLNANGTGPITLTLPSITTTVGYWYNILATGYNCTLAASGTNTFMPDNSSTAVIPAGYGAMVYEGVSGKWAITLMQRLPTVDTSTAQTVAGVKTFSSAPVMSGASITAGTIPTSALVGTFVDTSTNQTINGTKTFNTRISGSISQAYVSGSTGLTGQRLVMCGTIGTDNQLKGSSTLTYDQPTDTLNATNMNASSNLNTNAISFTGDTSTAHVRIGNLAGYSNEGVSCGFAAGQNLTTTSIGCVAVGRNALLTPDSGASYETAVGHRALESYITGNSNTAIGSYALLNLKYGTANCGVGAAAGGALIGATPGGQCTYNFAMGESALSNPYLAPYGWMQYTAASSGSVSSFTPTTSSGTIYAGQYIVSYGSTVANRVDILTYNTASKLTTLSSAVPIDQNVYLYFYIPGNLQTGGYSGATISTPTTNITIQTGHTISNGYRFSYISSAGNIKEFALVQSYNSSTGALVLQTAITIFTFSAYAIFDMNVDSQKGLNLVNNIAVGKYALGSVSTSAQNNTAFGVAAMTGASGGYDNIRFLAGSNNSAFGFQAGANLTGLCNNNTFIGCNADVQNATYNLISNSVAIGYNAKITASDQIVIGTSAQTANIPGTVNIGVLKYSSAFGPTNMNLTTTGTVNLTEADSGEIFTVSSSATGTVVFQLPTSPAAGTTYKIQNLTTSRLCQILCNAANSFSQNNQTATELRLGPNNFSTVELVYSNLVWYVIGGLFDVVRQSKASFITSGTLLAFGAATAIIHYPNAISGTTINAAVPASLILATPTYGTHLVNSATATITLPAINSAMIGNRILFRKTGTLAGVISITSATGNTVLAIGSITPTAAGTAVQVMSGTQTSAEIVCISSTQWAVMFSQ